MKVFTFFGFLILHIHVSEIIATGRPSVLCQFIKLKNIIPWSVH